MASAAMTPTATELVDALAVAGGRLDDDGRQIALATYRLLTDPAPVTVDRIADATNTTGAESHPTTRW